jgi:hypothetical protein
MTHPTHEELAEFLYDEGEDGAMSAARREEIAHHVEACGECRAVVASWRDVRTKMGTWQLPAARVVATPSRSSVTGTGLRWAVAAAVLLGGGFALARMTEKPVDLAALRTDLAQELRKEVRQELVAELGNYSAKQAAWQEEFQGEVISVVRQQAVNHASLRKDLETMAVLTQEEIGRLYGEAADVTPAMHPTTEQ